MNGDGSSEPADSSRVGPYGPAAVAMLTVALTAWPIAFNLGAYRAVFYDDIFRVVVASAVGLVIVCVVPPYDGKRLWTVRMALASPALWLAGAVTVFDSTTTAASDPFFGAVGLLIAMVSLPAVLKLLMDLFTPDLVSGTSSTRVVLAVVVTVVVAVVGYIVGANNDAFLTCDDFKIAGADQPPNCAQR